MRVRHLLVLTLAASLALESAPPVVRADSSALTRAPFTVFVRHGLDTTTVCPYPDGCGGDRKDTGFPIYVPIVLGIGLIAYLLSHGHPHSTSATPSPTAATSTPPTIERTEPPTSEPSQPPTAPPTPTTPPTSPPTIPPNTEATPTPTPLCTYEPAGGWFEPAQGAWQDDKHFPDRPTKQIVRLHDLDPVPHYDAQLKMVAERDTLLFGVEHAQDQGAQVALGSHDTIVLKLDTDCTELDPVRFAFTIESGGKKRTFVEPTVRFVPLHGPPAPNGKKTTITVSLPVRHGAPSLPRAPFALAAGPYRMEVELAKNNGAGTGIRAVVTGETVTTKAPIVHFVPVRLTSSKFFGGRTANYTANQAKQFALELGLHSAAAIPDFYPIKAGGLDVALEDTVDIDFDNLDNGYVMGAARRTVGFLAGFVPSIPVGPIEGQNAAAKLPITERFSAAIAADQSISAYLNNSATDRVVLVMGKDDIEKVLPGVIVSENLGNKTVLMTELATAYDVAHELAHTLPAPNWDPNSACGVVYHDSAITGKLVDPHHPATNLPSGLAGGERVRRDGRLGERERDDDLYQIMGSSFSLAPGAHDWDKWITQCTYWHLLDQFQNLPDPRVALVRGYFARTSHGEGALFAPVYDTTTKSAMKTTDPGTWSVQARDARGRRVATYPFAFTYHDEHGVDHRAWPFALEVPEQPAFASLELFHGGVDLGGIKRSSAPPSLRVLEPAAGSLVHPAVDGSILVRWTAAPAERGARLLSTVLYAPDRGPRNFVELHEDPVSSVRVKLDPHQRIHRIRVLVTDGTRSVESDVDVRTR